MSNIRKYVLVDEHDTEADYEYDSLREAQKAAAKYGHAVILRHYVREDGDLIYDDSELVWAPDGGNVWPPR
jgi:hypothetical protein